MSGAPEYAVLGELAKIVTALFLVAVGAIIQLLLVGWLSGTRAATMALTLWLSPAVCRLAEPGTRWA